VALGIFIFIFPPLSRYYFLRVFSSLLERATAPALALFCEGGGVGW